MPLSLLQKLCEVPLVFLDVETTGPSADWRDRVIEVGLVRVENGHRVAEFSQLVDPHGRISAGVSALTGITHDMVAGQPMFGQVLPRMMELLSGAALLGHNVRF